MVVAPAAAKDTGDNAGDAQEHAHDNDDNDNDHHHYFVPLPTERFCEWRVGMHLECIGAAAGMVSLLKRFR